MFSAYSWGDFFKFMAAILIPYYAFVIWKYYRHDIREWINNRGQQTKPASAAATDEDDSDASDLYTTRSYESHTDEDSIERVTSQPVLASSATTDDYPAPHRTGSSTAKPVDLPEGQVLGEHPEEIFEMPLSPEIIRPKERSLSEVINAAKRVRANDQGALAATDPDDAEAAELAEVINEQNKLASVLSGVQFNR